MNEPIRHIGLVEIQPEFLSELLGYPGGKVLHITQFNEETLSARLTIEHPDMPEVYPNSMFMISLATYKITSVKQKDNEVTIIAVRKDIR